MLFSFTGNGHVTFLATDSVGVRAPGYSIFHTYFGYFLQAISHDSIQMKTIEILQSIGNIVLLT